MTFNLPPHFSFNLKICAILSFSVIFSHFILLEEKHKNLKNFQFYEFREKNINQRRLLLVVSSKINWIIKRIINLSTSKPEAKAKVKIM